MTSQSLQKLILIAMATKKRRRSGQIHEALWRVHTPGLLQEVVGNPNTAILLRPMQIMGHLLAQVATRAAELNDPQLNALMMRLTLYEVADPHSKEYKPRVVERVIKQGTPCRERSSQ